MVVNYHKDARNSRESAQTSTIGYIMRGGAAQLFRRPLLACFSAIDLVPLYGNLLQRAIRLVIFIFLHVGRLIQGLLLRADGVCNLHRSFDGGQRSPVNPELFTTRP